jgi:glutathione peroxidase-family protein
VEPVTVQTPPQLLPSQNEQSMGYGPNVSKVGGGSERLPWNFYKYLLDRDGNVVDYYTSVTSPQSSKVVSAIEKLL